MRVFGGHDGGSGCAWVRMQVPLEELGRREGYEVTFADAGDRYGPPSITLSMLQGFDVIVAQRWNTHRGLEVWRRARTPDTRLVYDLDDDLWNITPENYPAWKLYGRGDIRDAVEFMAATADLVTVSTEPLAEVLRQFSGNVTVLPNCIPDWVLDLGPRRQYMGGRPRVGWAGAASHGADIGLVADPVRRFLKRFPQWDFQLNGTDYRPTIKAPAGRMVFRPWVQVNTDPEKFYLSADFDIGLCPLAPTAFARSKSYIKALEYGARGIPVIASDIEPYRTYIEHGVNGFLVKRDHEWLKYMSELAADDGLRAKMGEANRARAAECVISRNVHLWENAYSGLFRRGGQA